MGKCCRGHFAEGMSLQRKTDCCLYRLKVYFPVSAKLSFRLGCFRAERDVADRRDISLFMSRLYGLRLMVFWGVILFLGLSLCVGREIAYLS